MTIPGRTALFRKGQYNALPAYKIRRLFVILALLLNRDNTGKGEKPDSALIFFPGSVFFYNLPNDILGFPGKRGSCRKHLPARQSVFTL